MKLRDLNKALALANQRRNELMVIQAVRAGHEVEITIGGWPAQLADGIADKLADDAAEFAERELDQIEAEMRSIGIEVDIPRELYLNDDEPDDDDDDEPDDDDDDEQQPAVVAEPAQHQTEGAA